MRSLPINDDALGVPEGAGLAASDSCWKSLAGILEPHWSGGLFTVLHVDRAQALVRRAYTSNAADYPLGGTKQLMGTPWARHVIFEGRCFIAATPGHMAFAFADYATILELGCTTALNVPLREGGDVAWTVNLLRGGQVYSPAEMGVVKTRLELWLNEPISQSGYPRRA